MSVESSSCLPYRVMKKSIAALMATARTRVLALDSESQARRLHLPSVTHDVKQSQLCWCPLMIAKMRIFAKLVTRATIAAIHDVRTSVFAFMKPDLMTGTTKPAVRKMLMTASAANMGTVDQIFKPILQVPSEFNVALRPKHITMPTAIQHTRSTAAIRYHHERNRSRRVTPSCSWILEWTTLSRSMRNTRMIEK